MTTDVLQVRTALPLMQRVIEACGQGVEICFEGDVSPVSRTAMPGIDWWTAPEGTSSPEMGAQGQLRLPLNTETAAILCPDVLHRIGLRRNIWHITLEPGGTLIFAAHDKFGKDCAWIADIVGVDFLESLKRDGIISGYRVTPYRTT